MSIRSVVGARRVIVAAFAGATAALLFGGVAHAANPVLTVDGFYPQSAAAFDLFAAGPISIAPTPLASCNWDNPSVHRKLAALSTPLGTAKIVTADCNLGDTSASSSSHIANLSLLGGRITATAISSTCTDDFTEGGTASVTSSLTTLNGKPAPGGRAITGIPGVAAVYLDKVTDDGYTISTRAIEVVLLPVHIGTLTLPGQVIDVGGCSITRYPPLS